jgi:hypothetical protein
MTNWTFDNIQISSSVQMPEKTIGFIYKITNTINNRIYIGKKHINKGTKWEKYYGSSEDLKKDIKDRGVNKFKREIIKYCDTNINLTYYEIHYQCVYSVLTTDSYNKSIMGRFFKGRVT